MSSTYHKEAKSCKQKNYHAEYIKIPTKQIRKRRVNLIENCAKDSNRPFTEEETDTADKHETLSTLLLGKCKSKPHRGIIIRLSIKMAKSGNNKFEGNMN